MKKLNNYKVGDLLLITSKMKCGKETRAARVVHINYNGNGLVGYTGTFEIDGYIPTGQGAFNPEEIGTKKFSFHNKVEVVGHIKQSFYAAWYPKPGDLAYDLMC